MKKDRLDINWIYIIAAVVIISYFAGSYFLTSEDTEVPECAQTSDCPVINCITAPCPQNVCQDGKCMMTETDPIQKESAQDIYPQVWSQNSPEGESYEFKVNCGNDYTKLEECFLWDVDRVVVTDTSGKTFELEKDFNVNDYSGEITRRFVLYGEPDTELPATGDYTFDYYVDEEVVYTQTAGYTQSKLSYPTGVTWTRNGGDLQVYWNPPLGVTKEMWYKAIIWNAEGTPELFISKELRWDASSGVLENVPFVDGGVYVLNVAVFFPDGYAYSEYVDVEWN